MTDIDAVLEDLATLDHILLRSQGGVVMAEELSEGDLTFLELKKEQKNANRIWKEYIGLKKQLGDARGAPERRQLEGEHNAKISELKESWQRASRLLSKINISSASAPKQRSSKKTKP